MQHPNVNRHPNYPFEEVLENVNQKIAEGIDCYQKFTCTNCGARQTMPEANKFYLFGDCAECGFTTDIKHQGCNFMAVIGVNGIPKQKLQ